jgi:serine O-acetyltransferase
MVDEISLAICVLGDLPMSACPCSGRLARTLRQDLDRYLFQVYGDPSLKTVRLLRILIEFPGIWAVVPYRLTHHCLYRVRPKVLANAFGAFFYMIQRIMVLAFGIEIDVHAHIGPGFFVCHSGGIVIGPAKIGSNCNLAHGVTLGRSSFETGPALDDAPILGDRVWLGSGSVVAGPITLGNDVTVAANSLVTRDVPDRGVARGVPASVISLVGSFRQVSYPGMVDDPDRAASLAAVGDTPTDTILAES